MRRIEITEQKHEASNPTPPKPTTADGLFTRSAGGRGGRGGRRGQRGRGRGESSTNRQYKCTNCNMDNHSTAECRTQVKKEQKHATSSIPHRFAKPVVSQSRQKKSFATEFKLGVLAWWEHARIEDINGDKRPPSRLEVCTRYGLKHVQYLNRWKKGINQSYGWQESSGGCSQLRKSTCPRLSLPLGVALAAALWHATHLRLTTRTLIISHRQYLREGVEDLLACNGNV